MRKKYELMYIIRPDIEEEAIEAITAKYQDIIKNGGEITEHEVMGKRRLAYEIDKFREGIYILVNFEATPEVVAELNRVMRISDEVIRHLVVNDVA